MFDSAPERVTAAMIRAKYPYARQPLSQDDAASVFGPGYCVGGALVRYLGLSSVARFPDCDFIARAIRELNPRICREMADAFADSIVAANDYGNIDVAWGWVDKALAT